MSLVVYGKAHLNWSVLWKNYTIEGGFAGTCMRRPKQRPHPERVPCWAALRFWKSAVLGVSYFATMATVAPSTQHVVYVPPSSASRTRTQTSFAAKSYTNEEWEAKRRMIEKLYYEERQPLAAVLKQLGQIGFHVK